MNEQTNGRRMKSYYRYGAVALLQSFVLVAGLMSTAAALDNGLALTPPMGWNSWNRFGTSISEDLIKQTADAMVSSGMAAAGYEYVNIDDCWSSKNRDAGGNLLADPVTFPHGIKALADYVHSKGLKLGIYSDRGNQTCAGYPGSQGHEAQDAATWASWGVDYLKYDNCYASLDMQTQYVAMRDALAGCGRSIVYSECAWTFAPWMPAVGNLWRTTGDINASWGSVMGILDINAPLAAYAKPGAWNDPDMLEVGNGGLSESEDRSHFSLWCMMAAPLITGNDLRSMTPATTAILTNAEAIAVDQDSLGKQGMRVRTTNSVELWSKPLRDTSTAVLVFNRGGSPASLTFTLVEVGITKSNTAAVRDLWAHADKGQAVDSYSVTVQSHDVAMLKLVPGPDKSPPKIDRIFTTPDSTRNVSVIFNEPIDRATAETAANYGLNHALTVSTAVLQSDRQTVVVKVTAPLDTGVSYQLTVNDVKDLSGNVIAANSTISFTFVTYKPITKIRYYPRSGWESRMVGAVFEGTSGDKDAGPYKTLMTVTVTPAANAWTDVTTLTNNDLGYRYVRYRSPDNGNGNVSEIEFYRNTTKLTGTVFGTPGSWLNSGADYTKAFDGDVNTFFDYSQANGAYTGLDLVGGATPVAMAPLIGRQHVAQPAARTVGRVFDIRGRAIAVNRQSVRAPAVGANVLVISEYSDGSVSRRVSRR